ncbi:hypothetical protein [Clostridium sp. DSM 8431]|uniref:hypothetical protein n=1 Tax=Clostridium sp. DSM 8431 TaxID=1761781 RepID=UPI001113D9BB|nr:hypothetical protein [Clostridium sp. DSM 8431]
MKKILALIIAFIIFPISNALAADTANTPNTENSTTASSDENEHEETDSLSKMYDSYKRIDEKEWTDSMGNKELKGMNDEGNFKLTGLMNQLFFNVENMVPGDSVTKYMRLINTSNKDYDLYFEAKRKEEYIPKFGEVDLFDVLNLKITKTGEKIEEPVYNGKLFDQNSQKERIKLGTIKSNQEPIILTATVSMDLSAGNEYKNKATMVDWIFVAEGDEEGKEEEEKKDDEKSNPTSNTDPSQNPDEDGKEPGNSGSQNLLIPVNNKTIDNIDTYDLADYNGKGNYVSSLSSISKTGDNNYITIYILLACGSLFIGYVLFSKGKKNRKEQ